MTLERISEQETEWKELKELLSNLTINQNEMAKKLFNLSNAVIELQEIIKQKLLGGNNGTNSIK